eukprot:1138376-Pelagomonas_calceolata.AAC.5
MADTTRDTGCARDALSLLCKRLSSVCLAREAALQPHRLTDYANRQAWRGEADCLFAVCAGNVVGVLYMPGFVGSHNACMHGEQSPCLHITS